MRFDCIAKKSITSRGRFYVATGNHLTLYIFEGTALPKEVLESEKKRAPVAKMAPTAELSTTSMRRTVAKHAF
jgi:hypothetical protein